MGQITTIAISKKTKARFEALGHYKESQDCLLSRILDIFELKSAESLIQAKCSPEGQSANAPNGDKGDKED
jgi:hypothetical protein